MPDYAMADESNQRPKSLINKSCGFIFFGFLILFGLVEVGIAIAVSPVIGLPLAALMLLFGTAFVASIIIREFKIWKDAYWQFSLRTLLIVISIVAMALGGIMFLARS